MEKLRRFPILATRDLDEARTAVSSTYLDNRLTKLDGRDLRFSLNASEAYDVTVGYLTYKSEVSLQMPPSQDFYHVNLTTGGRTDAWRDDRQTWQTSNGTSGVVLLPDYLSRVTWSKDAEQVIYRFSRRRLENYLGRFIGKEITAPIEFDLGLNLQTSAGAGLYATALQMVDEFDRLVASPGFTHMVRPMEELVMTQLLFAARHNYTADLLSAADSSSEHYRTAKGKADRRLSAVREYIDANLGDHVPLESLASIGDLSIRSLHALFRSELRTTPRRYIQDRRLDIVRSELEAASESETVSTVSSRWGFTHAGRFASAYKNRFSETPSSTLRRSALSP